MDTPADLDDTPDHLDGVPRLPERFEQLMRAERVLHRLLRSDLPAEPKPPTAP